MRTLTKHLSWIWVLPTMFVRHPESRAPGLAFIGWKVARLLSFLAVLPLVVPYLIVVVASLLVKGLGWVLETVLFAACAPSRLFHQKMCERAADIRAIRRREGLTMRY